MLAYGLYDTKRSISAALDYFIKAADNDNAEACLEIVKLYDFDNDYVSPDVAKDYCQRAKDLGSEKAAERLNSSFEYESKKKKIESRIQAGDPKAIFDMVKYYFDKEDETYVTYLENGVDDKNVYCLLFKAKLLY